MAVKYLRLFDPTQQFQLKGGQLNVAGRLYVHYESTDDLADLYDENGTQLTQPVILDNNGRAAGLFVDSSKVYWLDVQDQFGMSQFTIRKMTPCGGGGGATLGTTYELVSSDGSIAIDKTTEGNVTTYDLTRQDDSTELLEWIRCDGATKNSDTYTPIYTDGTMEVGVNGIKVYADRYYHVTAHLRASKSSVQPYYDKVDVLFRLVDDNDVETNVIRQSVIVDSSVGLVQDFEVSTDVKVEEDAELLLDILNTTVQGITWEVLNLEAHRVFSGAPAIPGGVARKPWVEDNFQPTLTAGDNITIVNNVISATAAPQEQSDWTETDTTDVSYIKHKPSTKPVVAGENITITEETDSFIISANANSQVQADWSETDTEDPSYIQHKPDLSVYATTQAMNTALADKQDVISDLATIRSGAALGATATQPADLAAGLATKQDVISDLATIRSGAALGASAIQPSDLATVATTGDYDDLTDKPDLSIYAESSNLATVATTGSYDDLVDKPTIPAAQVNSDWNSNSGVSQILNKPTLSTVATTGDYNDLSNKPSIPAAQINSDWSESDTTSKAYIQNKPDLSVYATGSELTAGLATKQDTISDLATIRSGAEAGATAIQPSDLATVATTGDYDDLIDKPTIPSGVQLVPAATSSDANKVLTVDAQGTPAWAASQGLFVAQYGVTTYAQVVAAIEANKIVYCRIGSDWDDSRMAFLAYDAHIGPNNNVEFQYVRSNSDRSGYDSIFIYKLYSTNTWETTERSVKAVNQVPASTSSDEGKVLKVNSSGTPEWAVGGGGTTYTAGNGISIANDEISAKAGTGLEIADVSESTTDNLVCATMSSNWAYDVCRMTQALADIMNTSDGYTFTLAKPFDTFNMYIWPCIAKTSELNQGELQHYAYFGNYLTTSTPSTDGSGRPYEVSAGTQLTLKFSERDQFSTITVADILNDLSSYSLIILWFDEDSPYAAETMLSTAMTPETTATHTTTTNIQDAICVSNPLPASTVADANKVLKVNASGTPEWAVGGGGTTYTAGNGIAISSQNEISVDHDSTLSSSRTTTGNLGTFDRVSSYAFAYSLTAEEQAMLNGTSATPISSISISLAIDVFYKGTDDYPSASEHLYLQISTDSALSSANTARYYGSYVPHITGDEEFYNLPATVTINMPVGNSTGWTSQSLTFGNKLYLSMCVASTSDTTSVVTDTSELFGPVNDEYHPAPTITYTSVSSKLSVNVPALTTAGITDIQQVAALPATPVATVLYLIPET